MAVKLSYADVEATLAQLNRIADDKRTAFKARLKHFQRLGFPDGANTGTGKRVLYSVQMLLQLAFATELSQAGMSPKRVVDIINCNWRRLEWSLLAVLTPDDLLKRRNQPVTDSNLVWMLSPEALRDLSEGGEGTYDYFDAVEVEALKDLPEIMLDEEDGAPHVGENYRHLVIQLKPFLQTVLLRLRQVRPDISFFDVLTDIETELIEAGARQKKLIAEVEITMGKRSGDPEA